MATDGTPTPERDVNLFRIARGVVRDYLRSHRVSDQERDLLLSDACYGAVKAAAAYDPTRRADDSSLGGWCYFRARCEMIDGIRSRSPIPRRSWEQGVRSADDLPAAQRSPVLLGDWPIDVPDHADPYGEVDDRLLVDELLRSVADARARQIVEQRYLHGVSGAELATAHGLSGGRISQITKQACADMRAAA